MSTISTKREKDFQEFLERLESAKWRPMSKELDPLLSKGSLLQILDYFVLDLNEAKKKLKFKASQEKYRRFYLEAVHSLKPGEAYRLPKEVTGLARTLNVLRDDSGEFQLIVETKSKLKEIENPNKSKQKVKQSLPEVGGAFKTGKPAWRVDTGEIELFNLTMKFPIDKKNPPQQKKLEQAAEALQKGAEAEVAASRLFKGSEINESNKGQLFLKDMHQKISVYSIKAQGTLLDLQRAQRLTTRQTDKLIIELLNGVKRLHDKGYVHQDLKSDNVLIYGDLKGGYHLKIADFGLFARQGDPRAKAGIYIPAWSPELAYSYAYSSKDTFNLKSLGQSFFESHPHLFEYNPKLFVNSSGFSDLQKPHSANDMWALGLMIFEMRYGRIPAYTVQDLSLIKQDRLLRGLLEPNRQKRLTIEKALQIALSQQKKYSLQEGLSLPSLVEGKSEEARPKESFSFLRKSIDERLEILKAQIKASLGNDDTDRLRNRLLQLNWLQETMKVLEKKDYSQNEKVSGFYAALEHVKQEILKEPTGSFSFTFQVLKEEQKKLIEQWPGLGENSIETWEEKAGSLSNNMQQELPRSQSSQKEHSILTDKSKTMEAKKGKQERVASKGMLSSFDRHIKGLEEQYQRQKQLKLEDKSIGARGVRLGKKIRAMFQEKKSEKRKRQLQWLQEVVTFLNKKDYYFEGEKASALYAALHYISKDIQKEPRILPSDMLRAVKEEQRNLIKQWPELSRNSERSWDKKAENLIIAMKENVSHAKKRL